ncbi:DinB family protein [Gemmatimonas sp.]
MTSVVLHPRIREVITALDDAQHEMERVCATISPEQESRRVGDGWTVAQVVEHMAIVEDGAGRIVNGIAKQVAGLAETDESSVAPSLARYRVPDPSARKVVAPEVVHPTGGASVAESLARMQHSRSRLVALLESVSGTALGAASFPHPIFGPLDGYQWGLLAAQHQLRHLVQLRHILAS